MFVIRLIVDTLISYIFTFEIFLLSLQNLLLDQLSPIPFRLMLDEENNTYCSSKFGVGKSESRKESEFGCCRTENIQG